MGEGTGTDRLDEALDLFEALVDLPDADRRAQLEALQAEDPELAQEVDRLFVADGAPSFLDRDTWAFPELVSSVAADLDRPERFGNYRIVGELGRGGMGVVFEAEQDRPRRRVALKTLPALGVTDRARARFEVEIQALGQVLHPGIPQLYEVFEAGGRPMLAMELVAGEPLDVALRDEDPRVAAEVIERVADALEHAHQRGVVHRDLKPGNVLVRPDGQPKVLDFGIATLGGALTEVMGTPRYMAPEQEAGAATDARTDVYALGVLTRDVLGASRFRRAELAAILARATAASPDDRYATAAAFGRDLHAWRTLHPVQAAAPHAGRRVGLFLQRQRVPLVVAGIAVAVALGLTLLGREWADAEARRGVAEQAQQRLAVVQRLAARPGVDPQRVEEAFRGFVDDPAWDGTPALGEAWRWWADRQSAPRRRVDALAQAWFHAGAGADEGTVAALVDALFQEGAWPSAASIHAGRADGGSPRDQAILAAWRGDLGTLERTVDEGARPLLSLLQEARRDEERAWRSHALGDRRVHIAPGRLWVDDWNGHVLRSIDLPAPASHNGLGLKRSPWGIWVHVDGHGADYWNPDGDDDLVLEPMEDPGAFARGDGPFVAQAAGRFVRLFDAEGRLVHELGPASIGRGYLVSFRWVDLVPGGEKELLYAGGGWQDVGIQVWSFDEGAPRLLAHRPEPVYGVEVMEPPGEAARLFAIDAELGRLPEDFSPDAVAPRTVRELRLEGDRLTAGESILAWPRIWILEVGDADGDGLDDLAVSGGGVAHVLRQHEDGAWSPLLLPGVQEAVFGQADDDPADELWVRPRGRAPGWALGHADGQPFPGLADLVPDELDLLPPPPGLTPNQQARWDRAEALARAGLREPGITALSALGEDPGPLGAHALDAAVALAGARDPSRAVSVGPKAGLAARLLDHPSATEGHREHARSALASVHAEAGLAARVDEPMATPRVWTGPSWPWRTLQPSAVRTTLEGDATFVLDAMGPAVAELPFARTSGPLVVELDVDFAQLDWASGMVLELRHGEDVLRLSAQHVGGGPPSHHQLALRCGPTGWFEALRRPLPTGPERVQISWDPHTDTVACAVGSLRLVVPARSSGVDVEGAAGTLVLAPFDFHNDVISRAVVRTTRLSLAGAALAEPSRHPWGDPEEEAGRLVADPASRAQGLARLGRAAEADLSTLDVDALARLMRGDPRIWTPHVREQRPEVWAAAFETAWSISLSFDTPQAQELLVDPILAGLDPDEPLERTLLVERAEELLARDRPVLALQEVDRIADADLDEKGWALRARIAAHQGEDDGVRAAIAAWRAMAAPAFAVDAILLADPVLAPYAEASASSGPSRASR